MHNGSEYSSYAKVEEMNYCIVHWYNKHYANFAINWHTKNTHFIKKALADLTARAFFAVSTIPRLPLRVHAVGTAF